MRALVSFDGWIAEIKFANQMTGQSKFERAWHFGGPHDVPLDQAWVFSDDTALLAADTEAKTLGAKIGTFVGPIKGAQLFSGLPAQFKRTRINIGSPRVATWDFEQDAYPYAQLWARAIATEFWLTQADSLEKFAALRDYSGYIFFINPELDAVITAPGFGGKANPVLVFTAGDCIQKMQADYPNLKLQTLPGSALFAHMLRQGVDAIVFNAFGPGTTVVADLSLCEHIAALPAS